MDKENHEAVGVAFIAPSITPLIWGTPGVNPSFRSYTYDPDNRVIKTYQQYYLPLDQLLPEDDEYEKDQVLKSSEKSRLHHRKSLNMPIYYVPNHVLITIE